MLRIAIFVDGFVLPPKEGLNAHIYNLYYTLINTGFEPILFIGDRGWAKIRKLKEANFKFAIIEINKFYNLDFILFLVNKLKIDVLQSHSPTYICSILGQISKILRIPLVWEQHDHEVELAKHLNFDLDNITYQNTLQKMTILYCSKIRTLSIHDYNLMRSYSDYSIKATCIPPTMGEIQKKDKEFTNKICFIGNCSYKPNIDSVNFIYNEICDKIHKNLVIYIVGRGTENFTKLRNIIPIGAIDDIDAFLSDCCLTIAPILSGSGIKMKILLSLKNSIPVITTHLGSMGISGNKSVIISSLKTFSDNINEYFNEKNNKIFNLSYDFYNKTYSFDAISEKTCDFYSKISFSISDNISNEELALNDLSFNKPYWLNEKREYSVQQTANYVIQI